MRAGRRVAASHELDAAGPAFDQLAKDGHAWNAYNVKLADHALSSARSTSSTARTIVIALLLAAAALAAGLAFFIARAITGGVSSASTQRVSVSTEETSASAEEITASAQELAAMAQSLERLVAQFRLSEGATAGAASPLPPSRPRNVVCQRRPVLGRQVAPIRPCRDRPRSSTIRACTYDCPF